MASYETAYGVSIAVKRSINGFDIDWVDKDLIEVRRDRVSGGWNHARRHLWSLTMVVTIWL
jgi:hypothetical protein